MGWNARALAHHKRDTRHRKVQELASFAGRFLVNVVCEAHGTKVLMPMILNCLKGKFLIFHSEVLKPVDGMMVPDSDSGGIVVLLSKPAVLGLTVEMSEIVPGRVVCFRISSPDGWVVWLWAVHNFGIDAEGMVAIEVALMANITEAQQDPVNRSVLLVGDLNFAPLGVERFPISLAHKQRVQNAQDDARGILPPRPTRPHQGRWQRILDRLVEIQSGAPTHLCARSMSLGTIDRIFTSTPPSSMPHYFHQAGVIKDPMHFYTKGISDHAPSFWSFEKREPRGISIPLPLNPLWCKHPDFGRRVSALSKAADLDSLSLEDRINLHKEIFRDAALKVRDKIANDSPTGKGATLMRLNSISRAVWKRDYSLGQLLRNNSDLGLAHIDIVRGVPQLKDPRAFEAAIAAAKSEFFEREVERVGNEFSGTRMSQVSKKKAHLASIRRKASLWSMSGPRMVLGGAKLLEGEAAPLGIDPSRCVTQSKAEMVSAISLAWGKVFGPHEMDLDCANNMLEDYAREVKWDWELCEPPGKGTLSGWLGRAKNTTPGHDGIPNAAWAEGGEEAVESLYLLQQQHLVGDPSIHGFNFGIWAFVPKGEEEDDQSNGVLFRHPLDTRPLAMKCTDNKAVCASTCYALSPVTRSCTSALQRACPGRQLGQNIIELDVESRVLAMRCLDSRETHSMEGNIPPHQVARLACLMLFDFAAAFPSVFHAWIFLVLKFIKAPIGFVNLVKTLYKGNEAYLKSGSSMQWLFSVFSGVLQGCPLSGALFNFAMDPLLHLFAKLVVNPGLGKVMACADDIGIALSQLQHLHICHNIFCAYQRVSGLHLKARKCFCVLTSIVSSPHNREVVSKWLQENIPEWSSMCVCSSAKYLGIFLGPGAGSRQWVAPLAKFGLRVEEIAATGAPAVLAVQHYNTRAVSVLGYVAQFIPPPPNIKAVEMGARSRLLHMATSSLDYHSTFQLECVVGLKIQCVLAVMIASMVRASIDTFSGIAPSI